MSSSGVENPIVISDESAVVAEISGEKEELDLVICGDSIVKSIQPDLINPGKDNKLICLPGGKISHIRKAVIELSKSHTVKHLVLHVASNDTSSDPPAVVIRNMRSLIKEIKHNMPTTTLHISAVLPKINSSWLRGLNEINKGLYESEIEMGYCFIQHPKFASQGHIDDSLYSGDAIHLNKRGVAQLAIDIKYSNINFE